MKKLKKTLAVLLVLVMALTIVPFAGANDGITTAANFNDAADVSPDQRMALDVLAAVNVLRGEDGSIFPQRNVNRGEAAVIVARTVFGPDTADNLPLVQTGFRDVDGQGWDWAAPAIAQLHEQGIVIGVGDGLFNPNGSVTSAEMAAMFLRAVGFGVNGEFAGPRWQTNAIVYGMQWRVLAGVGEIDFTAPATREQVMQYAFNAMNVTESAFGLRFVHWSTIHSAYEPIELIVAGVPIVQTIYGRVFNVQPVGLVWALTVDLFGRPADRFTLRGRLIDEYTRRAEVTFTAAAGGAAVNAAIDGLVVNNAITHPDVTPNTGGIRFARNGRQGYMPAGTAPFVATTSSLTSRTAVSTAIQRLTGNGILVEVFTDFWNNITHVTGIRTDISTVVVNNPVAQTVTMMVITPDGQLGGHMDAVTLNTAAFGSATSLVVDSLHPLWDTVSGLDVGTPVLVRPAYTGGDVANPFTAGEVLFPEVLEGVLRATTPLTDAARGTLTVGTETHTRAAIMTQGAANAVALDTDVDTEVLLDTYGFVVHAVTGDRATRAFMFVDRVDQVGITGNVIRRQVSGRWPDGTPATHEVVGSIDTGTNIGTTAGDVARIVRGGNPNAFRLVASGSSVNAVEGANNIPNANLTPVPPTGLGHVVDSAGAAATITSVGASGTAMLASMHDSVTRISARQPALLLHNPNAGGGLPDRINVPFAPDAQYFWWNQSAAGGAGRWSVTDRNREISASDIAAYIAGSGAAENFVAIVEYRQGRPMISALIIPLEVETVVSPDTVVFISGWAGNHEMNNPTLYSWALAHDMDGNPIQTQRADGVMVNGIPIRALTGVNLVHNNTDFMAWVSDNQAGFIGDFFTFERGTDGLYSIDRITPEYAGGSIHLDDAFGFAVNLIATLNTVLTAEGGPLVVELRQNVDDPEAMLVVTMARHLPVTVLAGAGGTGAPEGGNVNGLYLWLRDSANRGEIRISVAIEVGSGLWGNDVRGRVFVHHRGN